MPSFLTACLPFYLSMFIPTCMYQPTFLPTVYFPLCLSSCVTIYPPTSFYLQNIPATPAETLSLFTSLPKKHYWIILMTAGGHFAGAVFSGKEVLTHKTFHRYTVRAKRGTAQGARDSQQSGKQPK